MTFALPWLLALGAAAIAGIIALHFIARDVPPVWRLPTARFVPQDRRDVQSRAAAPRDPWLLLLRVLALAALALAAAQPAWTAARRPQARVIVADLSRATADRAAVARQARALWRESDRVVVLDTTARAATLDSVDALATRDAPSRSPGRLSAALLRAIDERRALADQADSVELVLIAPLAAEQVDAALAPLRAVWPGSVRVVPVTRRTAPTPRTDIALVGDANDPLRATIALSGIRLSDSARVRIARRMATAADSALARAGGVLLQWPATTAARDSARGVVFTQTALVAPIARRAIDTAARAIAWFPDGGVAITEQPVGAGCVRDVGVLVPTAGDVAISPRFTELLHAVRAPCGVPTDFASVSAETRRLIEGDVRARATRADERTRRAGDPRLMRALLAVGAVLLLLELPLRRQRGTA
ncbi:MAG: BatA domain-containing protein [Gemmatimonadaceae bacterium]|nr:BatA domain-containing protein [Gemmatimonadaceae bacterium]